MEEQKKAGAFRKSTPLNSKRKKDKMSHKKLFETLPPNGQEGVSLLDSVNRSDITEFHHGSPDHQGSASFPDTLDEMELTPLMPVTPEEKKDWNQLYEEDTLARSPVLDSIAEEEKTVEEDVTTSFVTPFGLANVFSYFGPFKFLVPKTISIIFPGYFLLPLPNSICSFSPTFLKNSVM